MKGAIKSAFGHLWRRLPSLPAGGSVAVPILCYHSVHADPHPDTQPLPPELFEQHLAHLAATRTIIGLDDLTEALHGRTVLPANAVIITFDDGYADNYHHVFPALKRHRARATIFLPTGFIDGECQLTDDPRWGPLTWDQVREMRASGLVEFGGHGTTHRILSEIADDEAVEEVRRSYRRLSEELGSPPTSFAYPFGQGSHISPAALRAVREAGFTCACSTFWRASNTLGELFRLNRLMTGPRDSVDDLERKLRGDYDYLYWLHRAKAATAFAMGGRGIA